MITTISWSNYVIAIMLLLLVWYIFLGFRFYYQELTQFMSGKRRFNLSAVENKSVQQFQSGKDDTINSEYNLSLSSFESSSAAEDVEELTRILLNVIEESALGQLSKVEFKSYLRVLLNDYPFVKQSALRAKLNEFMVSECEKHPQLILSYDEVDGLWEEAI